MKTWWTMRRPRLLAFVSVMLVAWIVQTAVSAQLTAPPIAATDDWGVWIRDNAFTLMMFMFHMGVSWREFLDHRRRLEVVEKKLEDLDDKYAQNRVVDAVQEELLRRFDNLERRMAGAGR